MPILDNYKYWKGGDATLPNDWGTAANWCSDIGLTTAAGAIPNSSSWVFVGPNTTYTINTLGANRTIRALCVCSCQSGFTLTDNYTLSVTDNDAVIMSWMHSPTSGYYGGTLKVGTYDTFASIIFANSASCGNISGTTTVLDVTSSSSGSAVHLPNSSLTYYTTVTGHSTSTLVVLGNDGGHNTINAGATALLTSASVVSTTTIASGAVLAMNGSSNAGVIAGATLPVGAFTNTGTLGALPLDVLQAGI